MTPQEQAAGVMPCPFCGGEALEHSANGEFWMRCVDCNATSDMHGRYEKALEAWNRRANLLAPAGDKAADQIGEVTEMVPVPADLRVVAAAHRVRLTPEATNDSRAIDVIVSAPPPARHHNLFAIQPDGPHPTGQDSGFLLSDGSFASRERALEVALAAGQLQPKIAGDTKRLYSEDLW